MTPTHFTSLLALVTLVASCADPTSEQEDLATEAWQAQTAATDGGGISTAQLAHAARVSGASGVHLGGRYVLTNWHVCTDANNLVLHNDPGSGASPYREGAACKARASGSCNPPASVSLGDGTQRIRASGQAVFMSRAIDTCIVELAKPLTAAPSLAIDVAPVEVGQAVVVASYPAGAARIVIERCKVTKGVAPLRDPDRVNPSDLVVKSFEIDCATPTHGSSGAPVFDAASGNLLGLVWTGVCAAADRGDCRGPIYVTAASAWRGEHTARPAPQLTRLDALLESYGAAQQTP